jgi:hypothetical protein
VDRSSRTKAMKNRIDKGVAGRSMMAKNMGSRAQRSGSPETGLQDFLGVVGVCGRGMRCCEVGCGRGDASGGYAGETGRKQVSLQEANDGLKRATVARDGIGTATESAMSSSSLLIAGEQLGVEGRCGDSGGRWRWGA